MMTLANFLNAHIEGNGMVVTDEVVNARNELVAELNRGAEKAQKNRDLYDSVKPIVFDGLSMASAPVTIAELFDEIKDRLPDGFGKSKVQYAVTRLWIDELVKHEGKINTYSLRAE